MKNVNGATWFIMTKIHHNIPIASKQHYISNMLENLDPLEKS